MDDFEDALRYAMGGKYRQGFRYGADFSEGEVSAEVTQSSPTMMGLMSALMREFTTQFGFEPTGFLLGVDEWVQFQEECGDYKRIPVGEVGNRVDEFMGLSVRVKQARGIDLELTGDQAIKVAIRRKQAGK